MRRKRITAVGAGIVTACSCGLSYAAQTSSSRVAQLGAGVSGLDFPSVGRLVFGFALTVALAIGMAVLMRKIWPLFKKGASATAGIRPVGRVAVSGTLTVHLIELEGARVAVAESRSGVAICTLTAANTPPQSSPV